MSARSLLGAIAAAAFLAACAETSTAPDLGGASFAKSGTAPSGGSGGGSGGGSKGGGSTGGGGGSTTPTGGPPVAPSYTARINSIGKVPTGVYYGTPSQWTIGGYIFEGNYFTHLKPINGALVVGACVSVTFYESGTQYIASEIKTQVASKCS
jgi:hypothetical protein